VDWPGRRSGVIPRSPFPTLRCCVRSGPKASGGTVLA
jgi:hypothetical protein